MKNYSNRIKSGIKEVRKVLWWCDITNRFHGGKPQHNGTLP